MFKRGWQEGSAQVVARQTHEGTYRSGINVYAPTGLYHHVYDYVVDVQPDGGATLFRATLVRLFQSDTERRPVPGDTVRVKFSPKSHEVAFDDDALRREAQTRDDAEHSSFEAIASAAPGTTPVPAPALTPSPSSLAAQAQAQADGVSGADSILLASIIIAKSKGDLAEVERLKALLIERGVPIPGSI